jgi:hypothetical protein
MVHVRLAGQASSPFTGPIPNSPSCGVWDDIPCSGLSQHIEFCHHSNAVPSMWNTTGTRLSTKMRRTCMGCTRSTGPTRNQSLLLWTACRSWRSAHFRIYILLPHPSPSRHACNRRRTLLRCSPLRHSRLVSSAIMSPATASTASAYPSPEVEVDYLMPTPWSSSSSPSCKPPEHQLLSHSRKHSSAWQGSPDLDCRPPCVIKGWSASVEEGGKNLLLACLFCRRRKFVCGPPPPASKNK